MFADALHNLGDVLTTVALWIAFVLSNRAANQRYTYGYHRSEDLAGIFIVLVIIAGAWESIEKLTIGSVPTQLYLSMAAALVGIDSLRGVYMRYPNCSARVRNLPSVGAKLAKRLSMERSLPSVYQSVSGG
jgi:divalent metal cation (Fe/Co/Zn/Cd) transporter